MERILRSWELVKQSWTILKADKQLVLLPVISAISCLLVTGVIVWWGWSSFGAEIERAIAAGVSWHPRPGILWLTLLVFYLANYFVIMFFNVALIGAALERLAGRPATVRGGLSRAWERKGKILEWAFLAATVGVLLKIVEERVGGLGRLVTKFIGVAWTLASYFVAPILAFEGLGPLDALKRSAKLFRENWGEDLVGTFSISLIFMLLALAGTGIWVVAVVAGGTWGLVAGSALLLFYLLGLGVVSTAVQGIFTAALYRYALTKTAPPGFALTSFSMAWRRKSK
jgi:hypothetical protein